MSACAALTMTSVWGHVIRIYYSPARAGRKTERGEERRRRRRQRRLLLAKLHFAGASDRPTDDRDCDDRSIDPILPYLRRAGGGRGRSANKPRNFLPLPVALFNNDNKREKGWMVRMSRLSVLNYAAP